MFNTILYEIFLWLFAIAFIPKLIYQRIVSGKYRSIFRNRFGKHSDFVRSQDMKSQNSYVIWLHAVSVGETKAVASLAKIIRNQYPNAHMICSAVTETGYAEAKRTMPFVNEHLYLPFDFSWNIRAALKQLRPNLVILCETDFWYNFLRIAKELGSINIVVNAKISERSFKRFLSLKWFSKKLFDLIDLLCVQNELYLERFKQLSIPEARLIVTGNLKFDDDYTPLSPEKLEEWRNSLGILPKNFILTVGSTHAPEEQMIIDELRKVWKDFSDLKVILVPRHPERFDEVYQLLIAEQIPSIRFSKLSSYSDLENAKVILVDAMGKLRLCYQISDVAIVAGSYVKQVGGHNILEPLYYGVPAFFGPYMQNQPDMLDLVTQVKCGGVIPISDLAQLILEMINNPQERKDLGERAINLVSSLNGTSKRSWEAIKGKIK